jgi:charged multivesicular body protein 6
MLCRLSQIDGVLSRERQIAKEALANGNKAQALTALRRRKYQESLLVKTDQQLENLQQLVSFPLLYCRVESNLPGLSSSADGGVNLDFHRLIPLCAQVSSIEFALVEKDILFGLKQGNSVLKELNRETSLENVEKLLGETADAVAYQEVQQELELSLTSYPYPSTSC